MDHGILGDLRHKGEIITWLTELRSHAVAVNRHWAEKLGINPSAAITCVKPSGTVSQLVDSASGIHPRWSRYYIRRIRCSKTDGLYAFLKDQGIPCEDDKYKLDGGLAVFSFPIGSPDSAVVKDDLPSCLYQVGREGERRRRYPPDPPTRS